MKSMISVATSGSAPARDMTCSASWQVYWMQSPCHHAGLMWTDTQLCHSPSIQNCGAG